jgi:hypothetical protein
MDWLNCLLFGVGASTYLFVGAAFSRRQYVRIYTNYLRWKAEAPDALTPIYRGYEASDPPPRQVTRKHVTYYSYFHSVNREVTPWLFMPLWLPIFALGAVYIFTHPTVALPNDLKIKELEADLARMDEEWKASSGEDE